MLRKLVSIADEISAAALNPQGKEARQLLDEAESKVFKIAQEGERGSAGFQEIQPLLTQVVERIDELYHRESESDVTGVPTGFADLDKMTSGLQAGDLVIVAGRPSMGKTSFSMNIGEHVAIEQGCRWRSSRWKWARCSWPCVCWARWACSTSIACVPASWSPTIAARHPRGATDAGRAGLTSTKRPRSARWKCAPARGAWRASAGSWA